MASTVLGMVLSDIAIRASESEKRCRMFELKAVEGFTAGRCCLDSVPVRFETAQEDLTNVLIVVHIKEPLSQK